MEANPKDYIDEAREKCPGYEGTRGDNVVKIVKPTCHWAIMPFIDCWEYTESAIHDVLNQSVPVKLLLIDNGSSDETRQLISGLVYLSRRDNVYVWHHRPPLPSISATWNRALDFVWEAGGHYCWVTNNDARYHKDTLEALTIAVEMYDAAFVSAVGVREEEFDPDADPPGSLKDKGGPDFSCFVITKDCHAKYRFDENFIPAYFEDNDFHRRMILAGDGEKIFSVNIPYLHWGSKTINRSPEVRDTWGEKFTACREYYIRKWGGLPHHETYDVPFGGKEQER
jgi:glycosyltransferase involved in cell wall biosynthesis